MNAEEQWKIISQNVERYVGENDLKEKIAQGKQLRVKLGVDPTRPDLTYGHWVVFNKLRQLQSLGHQIIFLIGDFTTQIGDPSGRSSTRPVLTSEQIAENSKTYLEQAFKILDGEKTEVRRNSEWFGKMSFSDLLSLSRNVTVAQMLERDDFTKRYSNKTPIALIEFLYPILQAYDSVVLKADIELGGMDQLFNLCMGRQFQKIFGQSEQAVLCMPLLVGLDGVKKMSKSYDNYIAFNDTSRDMYGKIMSIPDEAMWIYFKLLGLESETEIEARKKQHPMMMKKALAYKLVKQFYGESIALEEQKHFETVFSQKKLPDDMPVFSWESFLSCESLVDVIVNTKLYEGSKKELKRLIEQGGVEVNEQRISSLTYALPKNETCIVRVGKKLFFKVK
mgnify:CR=1 FL=1